MANKEGCLSRRADVEYKEVSLDKAVLASKSRLVVGELIKGKS